MTTAAPDDAVDATAWTPAWGQALSDCRDADDEPGFADVTVRLTAPAAIGGDRVRLELSNRFGGEPVQIGRSAVTVSGRTVAVTYGGQPAASLAAGTSLWSDPAELAIRHGDNIAVDLYLPEPTPYATAGGFRFDRSQPGDFAGAADFPLAGLTTEDVDTSREFPAVNTGATSDPAGTGWSLPAGGPFLRTIEVAGAKANAVVVALGGSSTAMGWPQYAAGLLSAGDKIAIINRGISGNRIRLDAPPKTPSWGRAGLARFDEDVLGTHGVSHVVIAYNSNDWGLPGRVTPLDEMPTLEQLIGGYEELITRSQAAGLQVILATVTPLAPETLSDAGREGFRQSLNDWIRACGHRYADFDAAIRSKADPSRLEAQYAAPDNTHPNINGEKRLAQTVITRLGFKAESAATAE
ncbi:MAG: GDSL-type esterase/lipase family protein [Propionibacteriaceae bacterium]|jgi:lysophospholipase L1-like esterase|nr:GDSL-type esterase/lipase family protein [Propionibacteriaceae bacterium]